MSHLTAARNQDGVHGWNIDSRPTFSASPEEYPEEWWGGVSKTLGRPCRPARGARRRLVDAGKLGLSAQPIETVAGWLIVYLGVRQTPNGALYRVGLALLTRQRR